MRIRARGHFVMSIIKRLNLISMHFLSRKLSGSMVSLHCDLLCFALFCRCSCGCNWVCCNYKKTASGHQLRFGCFKVR